MTIQIPSLRGRGTRPWQSHINEGLLHYVRNDGTRSSKRHCDEVRRSNLTNPLARHCERPKEAWQSHIELQIASFRFAPFAMTEF